MASRPSPERTTPVVAEFVARYAGYTCQELAHDYEQAFAAARKCAADFDWDAVVPNMLATWTGMTQAIGLKYYMIPGIDLPQFAMMLCGTLGIMGILTPYATGPSPVYYGSGYLPSKDYWRLGAIFGVIYIAAYLLIGVPWFAMLY